MSIINVKSKYQIVIPAKLRKAAGIEVGDFLNGRVGRKGEIILAAQTFVNREKLAHLPKGVRDGLRDVHAGRVSGPFETSKDLTRYLNGMIRRSRSKRAQSI